MKENRRLRRELEESRKEILFLKKAARLKIYPNGYYNYRKHRKADYYAHKSEVLAQIEKIYHEHNGVDGYRSMTVYLERRGYNYSSTTIHKNMNHRRKSKGS